VPEPGVPESFKVLIKELQSLGMDVKMLSSDEQEIEMRDLDDEEESQQAEGLSINEQVDTESEAVELEKDAVVKE
jgi:DNA-directed RNA polymerase subunit beta